MEKKRGVKMKEHAGLYKDYEETGKIQSRKVVVEWKNHLQCLLSSNSLETTRSRRDRCLCCCCKSIVLFRANNAGTVIILRRLPIVYPCNWSLSWIAFR